MSSLEEYDHLRVSLKEIVDATNNFSTENLIGEGRSAKVYKGQLLRSEKLINVAVRRLDFNFGIGQGNVHEFKTEISILSRLKHVNLNSIVGFCDENGEKIIVKEHVVNASLDRYLNSSTFTWLQRLQICVGAACALDYLHHYSGTNYGIIHRNIKSSKILVDETWFAKVSGLELLLVIPERRTRLLLSPTMDTFGYVDPVSIKSGSVTYKSDSYSLGMVLFEVICGRLCMIESDDDEQRFLAPLVKLKYEEGKLDELIPRYLRKQMNQESLSLVAETAYYCLKEQRTHRPDMTQIGKNLFRAYKLQRAHENRVHSMVAVHPSPDHLEEKFKHMKISFEKIESATRNFDKSNCIGEGGFGKVYKAELECFDNKIQGVDQDVVRKTFTVAIKRILDRQDEQGKRGFLTEIEMLTSCEHPNVVSLLGFCNEGQERILIYEYASKGSLDDHLGSIDKMTNHTWMERLQMCLDIAQGLNYLHTKDKERIIHRDIKSANILLDDNWKPKIADFGLSKSIPMGQHKSSVETNVVGTDVYIDPEYVKTRRLRKESDVYSFGVVLFEILCGRLAYDQIYYRHNYKGLPSIARRCFIDNKLKNIIDPKVMEETDENVFTLNKGPNEESLNTFLKIANQCLEETQVRRPTMEVVIKDLQKALNFQVNRVDIYKIPQERIKSATENFSEKNLIGKGAFGDVYKGKVLQGRQYSTVAVKRHVADRGQGEYEFLRELEVLFEYKHENVIGLVGYHNEPDERIIVYEHACHGSVDKYLSDASLTWAKRIKICIDVASGLRFLHGDAGSQERVIHRDIKSSNILLNGNWQAKISDFGLSMITPINQNINQVFCNPVGTVGYVDPIYIKTGSLTKECDMFSFGVFLIEIMCGRLVMSFCKNGEPLQSLVDNLFKPIFKEGKVDEIVFDGIKGKIVPKSLILFSNTVHQCLHDERKERPTADQVIKQLEEALNIQEDYDMWEPKLPRDYKELIRMSKSPSIYPTENKKYLYDMLSTGILLQNDKVWFSLSANGMRNEMISATMFSYKNQKSLKWSSTQSIRFPVVAQILDISDMKIEVNITPQYLSPNIIYGVYVVFKFCDPRKLSSKPAVYVNLKYKIRSKTLHSYFATWRDSEWMMLELDTFLNLKETTEFKVLLEGFSQYCRGSGAIFVEGIEFRAIHNVEDGGIEKLKKVQPLSTDNDEVINKTTDCDEGEKLYLPREVNEKKCHMLSAQMVLYDYSNVKYFNWISLAESRFIEVAKLQAHEVFRIKCKIDPQSLSSDTDYACYLVFKLSEECNGLQCPVKVRDELLRKNKETKVIYFKSPSSLSVHSIKNVAEQRTDKWMEVIVWEFNSSNESIDHHLPMNLKLRCYEGTMSGLIVRGIEFRPI